MEGVIVKELMPHNVPNVRVKFVAFLLLLLDLIISRSWFKASVYYSNPAACVKFVIVMPI